jgi:hypothetical protein
MFSNRTLAFHFGYKTCSRLVLTVLDPARCPDDVLLSLDVPGIVGAHAFRRVADQVGLLAGVGAVVPPPSGLGHAQIVHNFAVPTRLVSDALTGKRMRPELLPVDLNDRLAAEFCRLPRGACSRTRTGVFGAGVSSRSPATTIPAEMSPARGIAGGAFSPNCSRGTNSRKPSTKSTNRTLRWLVRRARCHVVWTQWSWVVWVARTALDDPGGR